MEAARDIIPDAETGAAPGAARWFDRFSITAEGLSEFSTAQGLRPTERSDGRWCTAFTRVALACATGAATNGHST